MSFILLRKPYTPEGPLTPWGKMEFVDSVHDASYILKQKQFKFVRGDLFTAIPMEYVSDIDAHAENLWVASSRRTILRSPNRYPNQPAVKYNWVKGWNRASIFSFYAVLVSEYECMTRGYAVALAYEAASLIQANGSRLFKTYMPFIKEWIDGKVETNKFYALIQQIGTEANEDENIKAAIVHCMYAIVYSGDYVPNLRMSVTAVGRIIGEESVDGMAREMVPLPMMLLAILKKHKFKLSWETS